MVHGGMFFKLCPKCYEQYEDDEAIRMIDEYLMQITDEEDGESAKSAVEQQE